MKEENEVLFQRIGKIWYIFTQIRDDIFYSILPQGVNPKTESLELYEVIEKHMKEVAQSPDDKKFDLAS